MRVGTTVFTIENPYLSQIPSEGFANRLQQPRRSIIKRSGLAQYSRCLILNGQAAFQALAACDISRVYDYAFDDRIVQQVMGNCFMNCPVPVFMPHPNFPRDYESGLGNSRLEELVQFGSVV